MLKRNLENLSKFLRLKKQETYREGVVAYVFANDNQAIRTDLLLDQVKLALQDKQKPFINHSWNEQWFIFTRMANDDISYIVVFRLNDHNKVETIVITERSWHCTQSIDLIN